CAQSSVWYWSLDYW
nr:immunoglobulin heavy chain junction region [Macaca mulatta]